MMRYNNFVILSLVVLFLLSGVVAAANDFIEEKSPEEIRAEMSASGLLAEGGRFLAQENYFAAIPFLKDYLERMKDADDRRVRALMQNVRFKLGKIMVFQGDYRAATTYFEQYLQGKPVYRRREALKTLAVSYFEIFDYQKSIAAVTNAFAPPPVVEEEVEEKLNVEKLDEEALGGLTRRQLRRFEKEGQEFEDDLGADLTSDKPAEEPEYTLGEKVLLNMTLAESYSALEEWELSVEPYEFVINNAQKLSRRGYAIMKLVSSLSALDRFDRVQKLILELAQTDAKFDIRVNMAMMNAATSLLNSEQYDSALVMFRMILPRRELTDHYLKKINRLRGSVGLPQMQVTLSTNIAGRTESLLGYAYAERQTDFASDGETTVVIEMPKGLLELEESMGTLMTLPPYENQLIYRLGQLYRGCGRPWEALGAFDLMAERSEDSEQKVAAFCDALQVLIDPLEKYDRVEKQALSFLDTYTEGLAPRQVAYYLTAAYQKQKKFKEIKALRPYLEEFDVLTDPVARQYECELYYMQAIADLMLLNYKEAQSGFAQVLEEYPASHQEDNLRYWHAMTHLFQQNYETAYNELESYLNTFPEGEWVDSTWFQGGVCLFAMEKYELAQQRFTYVIDTFPDASVYPDACSMRGDLLGSQGLLDEAIQDYQEAIATAQKPLQATYAVFQMTAIFEAEGRFDDIITVVNSYLDRYGEEADVAKAAYWIGKTKMAQGRVDEAIDAYLDTVIRYGVDIRQDGVDLIIAELMNVARRIEKSEVAQLKQSLIVALRETDNVTLQLRLRVMLAELDGTMIELGETLIAELDDLKKAPPPILAVICDASFAKEDYSRAEDILTIFQNYFEDSEYMRAAYKLRSYDLFSQGLSAQAMDIVLEAQGLYGADSDTAWIQLMKGRLEMQINDFESARETFQSVLQVRIWRGEPYAQACYYLGQVEEKAGDLNKAFAWHQRTYTLYKGLAGGYWAAESYLASARCLQQMGRDGDMRNTYRAMLYDKYVNTLPQAEVARTGLSAADVLEIEQNIAAGMQTNLVVTIEAEETP